MKNKIDIGEKLYRDFVKKITEMRVLTPRTTTLELFEGLARYGENKLLLREMMKEFLNNFDDTKIIVKSGELYYQDTTLRKCK